MSIITIYDLNVNYYNIRLGTCTMNVFLKIMVLTFLKNVIFSEGTGILITTFIFYP